MRAAIESLSLDAPRAPRGGYSSGEYYYLCDSESAIALGWLRRFEIYVDDTADYPICAPGRGRSGRYLDGRR